jgi:hypothetical protein
MILGSGSGKEVAEDVEGACTELRGEDPGRVLSPHVGGN